MTTASINFSAGTTITSNWLNAVDEAVFDDIINVKLWGATGNGSTNDYAAIQSALDFATDNEVTGAGKGYKLYFPPGTYLIGTTLRVPNATVIEGAGRQQTIFRPYSGLTGPMFTDKGNASKIFLKHFRAEAMGTAGVTAIIKMGYNSSPFAQAEMYDLFLSGDIPGGATYLTGCKTVDLVTNVATITEVETGYADYSFYLGPNSTVTIFNRCFSINAGIRDFSLNGSASLNDCEIEAPIAACVGVYCSRETVINNLSYSQANATTNPYAIEIDVNCPLFSLNGFTHLPGAGSVLTNVIKDNRSGVPTNWPVISTNTKNLATTGDSVDSLYPPTVRNMKLQCFCLRITNTAGTIQHRISANNSSSSSTFAEKINAASGTLQNTPTGADAGTAFAFGGKRSSANTNAFIFDTGAQIVVDQLLMANIVFNDTSTAYSVLPTFDTYNVNGTSKVRLVFYFYNSTTGAALALDTVNIAAGKKIDILFMGYLA